MFVVGIWVGVLCVKWYLFVDLLFMKNLFVFGFFFVMNFFLIFLKELFEFVLGLSWVIVRGSK